MPYKKKRKAAATAEADQAPDVATPPAKRGRPSKAAKEAALAEAASVLTPPAKRGRPPKAKTAQTEPTQNAIATSSLVKTDNSPTKASAKSKATANTSLRRSNRGPANADSTATGSRASRSATNAKTNGAVVAVKETKPKGKATAATPVKASTAKKGSRGVYKKKSAKARGKAAATANVDEEEEEEDDASDEELNPEPVEEKPAKRGRKANFSINVPASLAASEEAEDADEEDADEPSYWLMKAEPESRIEKGKDVKFSIDDLLNATEPEAWDGKCSPLYLVDVKWYAKTKLMTIL